MDASRCRYPPLCSSDEHVLRLSKLTPYFEAAGRVTASLPPYFEAAGRVTASLPPYFEAVGRVTQAYPLIWR